MSVILGTPIDYIMMVTRECRVLVVENEVRDEAQGRQESRKAQSPKAVAPWRSRDGEQNCIGRYERKSTDGSPKSCLEDS
jgi:hypothetical protein